MCCAWGEEQCESACVRAYVHESESERECACVRAWEWEWEWERERDDTEKGKTPGPQKLSRTQNRCERPWNKFIPENSFIWTLSHSLSLSLSFALTHTLSRQTCFNNPKFPSLGCSINCGNRSRHAEKKCQDQYFVLEIVFSYKTFLVKGVRSSRVVKGTVMKRK